LKKFAKLENEQILRQVTFEAKHNNFIAQARHQTARFPAVVDSTNQVSSSGPKFSNELETLRNRIAEIQAYGSMVDRNLTSQLTALSLKVEIFSKVFFLM